MRNNHWLCYAISAQIFALVPIIAVMFTFSFSSAFAATGTGTTTYTHSEAVAKAQSDLISKFTEEAAIAKASIAKETEYKEDFGTFEAHIPASFYTAAVDMLVADYTKYVTEATHSWQENTALGTEVDPGTIATAILSEAVSDLFVFQNAAVTGVVGANFGSNAVGIETLILKGVSATTDLEKYYQMQIWASALDTMKAEAKAELAKVDMALYTDDVISNADYDTLKGTVGVGNPYKVTWKAAAQDAIDALTDAIDDVAINPTKDFFAATKNALDGLWPLTSAAIVAEDTVTDINSNTIVVSYKLADPNLKTAKDLKGTAATEAAAAAAKKAEIQSTAADLMNKALAAYNTEYAAAGTDAAKKVVADNYAEVQDRINAWTTVNTYLVEKANVAAATTVTVTAVTPSSPTLTELLAETTLPAALTKVNLFETAQDQAAAAKIAVDKDGALKYDATVIDSNLAKLKEKVYDGTVTTSTATKTAIINNAEAGAADTTPWLKEVAVAQAKEALEADLYNADGSDKYYDIEKAKVQAKYDKLVAKIEASTTKDQLKVALGTANYAVLTTNSGTYNFGFTAGIDNKAAVDLAVAGLGNFNTGFIADVNSAINYLNWGIKAYEDGFRATVAASDPDAAAFLAENGVRTYNDIAAKASLAKEYAESLPTNGAKKATQAEFDAMIKALPTVVTLADKEQVAKAAAFAADNGLAVPAKLTQAKTLVENAEKKEIDKLFNALPTTITVADKDAVKAAIAAEDAYRATAMYGYTTYKNYSTQFEALRDAEKAAVEKQIALLPAATTKADVEAAKAAADAFVAEYKDAAYGKVGYDAAIGDEYADRLAFAEAYATAQEIKAIESIKVKTSTKAYKGYIKVSWTTIGDAEAADGYQIYRSTKATSAGKKIYTTKKATSRSYKNSSVKKGTKYYYKVRAYKVVDGVTYYSDWSTRGIRTAK